MSKKSLGQGLGLVLLLTLILLPFTGYHLPITECSAEEEEFIITTYYPSPYGSYNQLSVYRSVTYKPLNKNTITDPSEGELVYNNADDTLYLYNGSKWVGQGGGTAVMYLSCSWGTDYNAGSGHGWDGSCTSPSCPSGWSSVTTFSEPISVACPGPFNYSSSWSSYTTSACSWTNFMWYPSTATHPVTVGRSVRVCVKD